MRRALYAASSVAIVAVSPAWSQTSASPYTTGYRIDEMGRLTGTISPDPDAVGSGNPHQAVRNTYDAAGRLTRVETGTLANWQAENVRPKDWVGFERVKVVDIMYDLLGRKLTETVKDGALVAVALTQYSYDGYGRLECTALRMNPAEYGSLPTSACLTDTEGGFGPDRITRNHYDAAGRLIKVEKAVSTQDRIDYVRYEYTANSKQKALIDANNNRAEMTWDGYDRQSRWIFPSKTTVGQADVNDFEEYGYDKNGNRTSLTKRDERSIVYTYDNLNRVVAKAYPQGGADTVHYDYDLRNLQLKARFNALSGQGLTQTYDVFGRQAVATTDLGGATRTLEYGWDKGGNRVSLKHPDGTMFAYDYDGLNRLQWIKQGVAVQIEMGYRPFGALHYLSRANGLNTLLHYDTALRPWMLVHDFVGTSSDVNFTFGYNPAGQIVSRARDNDGFRFTGYVPVDRAYTRNGLNQYTAAGPATFCYDRNGNLTSDGSSAYKYDIENRLIEVRDAATPACINGLASYTGALKAALSWDPMGRLHQVVDHVPAIPTTRTYVYDGDELIGEYGGANLQRRYVHGVGSDDPLIWYEGSDLSARRFYHTDHQGSVIAVSNGSGGPFAINGYDEYGIPNLTNVGTFQYTGQAWLPELRVYHYKARIYSPTLGRFLQTDPIGYDDQVNLYAYVSNDPLNRVDPTGKDGWLVSRPSDYPGQNHMFVVVADEPGETPKARFSYGPTEGTMAQKILGRSDLVSETNSRSSTDRADARAWQALSDPKAAAAAGITMVRIKASDGAIIRSGNAADQALGTHAKPGGTSYNATGPNSNSAAYAVANSAVVSEGGKLGSQPKPEGVHPGGGAYRSVELIIQRECVTKKCRNN